MTEIDFNSGNEDIKVPYFAVKLTAEQFEQVRNRKIEYYYTDGKILFEVLDQDRKPTGEYVFYVMFK